MSGSNKITGAPNPDESPAGCRRHATLRLIADDRLQLADWLGSRACRCGAECALAQLCARLEVSASDYHALVKAQPSKPCATLQDAALLLQIQAIHAQHKGRYDALRIREALVK